MAPTDGIHTFIRFSDHALARNAVFLNCEDSARGLDCTGGHMKILTDALLLSWYVHGGGF